MKLWKLTYELKTNFSSPVNRHSYSLRCFPQDLSVQKVTSCQCDVHPCSVNTQGRDSFGNPILTGFCEKPHDSFNVKVQALVETHDNVLHEEEDFMRLGKYRYATEYTTLGESLKEFCKRIPISRGENPWERTRELMNMLYDNFCYQTGSTTIKTTAEEAFDQGRGVCQDYAHILLTLCRAEGMTARYVAGAIPGEGETHAWIEVYDKGCWKGFDPTNNKDTDEDYIRFAFGRDAHDCALNRGIFLGQANQMQAVYVKMEELEN